ncbi:hypothetical protein Nmel_018924 [Mimus melanotis]
MSSLGAIWEQMVAAAGCGTPRALPTGGCRLFPNMDVTTHIPLQILGGPSEARPLVGVALMHNWGLEVLSLRPCESSSSPRGQGPSSQEGQDGTPRAEYTLLWRKWMFPGIRGILELGKGGEEQDGTPKADLSGCIWAGSGPIPPWGGTLPSPVGARVGQKG